MPTTQEIFEFAKAGIGEMEDAGPEEPRRNTTTQDGVAVANDLEEIYGSIQEIFELAKAGIGKTKDADPEEMPRDAAQEDVTVKDTKGDSPDELLKEPATKRSASEKIYETTGGNPEGPLRDTAALEDVAANTPLRRTQRFRKKTKKASELDFCDL